MGMTITIGVAGAIDNHGIVEQRLAVHVFGLFHFFQEPGQLLDVPEINFFDLINHLLFVLMMREVVMAFGEAQFGKRAVAAFAGE